MFLHSVNDVLVLDKGAPSVAGFDHVVVLAALYVATRHRTPARWCRRTTSRPCSWRWRPVAPAVSTSVSSSRSTSHSTSPAAGRY